MSDSPELMDFAIGLVNFALNLCNWQVKVFEEVKFITEEYCETNSPHQKVFAAG